MNDRTNDIMECIENNQLGLDDTFRFRCTMCGKCCIHREDILLNPRDLFNISSILGMSPAEVIKKYCECYIGNASRIPVVRLKPQGKDRRCPLLNGTRCSVHSAKPGVCAMFPLGRGFILDKDKSNDITTEQIIYFFNGANCGDKKKEHTVREWLTSFNIPLEDEFYVKWTQFVTNMHEMISKMEKKLSEDLYAMIMNTFLCYTYLGYDIDKEFLPQFEENINKISAALKKTVKLIKEAT